MRHGPRRRGRARAHGGAPDAARRGLPPFRQDTAAPLADQLLQTPQVALVPGNGYLGSAAATAHMAETRAGCRWRGKNVVTRGHSPATEEEALGTRWPPA